MFNTQSDEFYTVLVDNEQVSFVFETMDEAIDWIKEGSSWDCRPHCGRMDEWYDAGRGRTYKIVPCDDCGRY